MNYLLLTDTHFGHRRMEELCGRPPFYEDLILQNLRRLVNPGDVLIHLGDVYTYDPIGWNTALMRELHGVKRWLVKGNHDKKSNSWFLSRGWDFVADEVTLEMFGKRIALSHKPITAHSNFDINIHGHHHNTLHHPEDETTEKHRLLYLEHEYAPVNLRRIVEGG